MKLHHRLMRFEGFQHLDTFNDSMVQGHQFIACQVIDIDSQCGLQFHGSKALYSSTRFADGKRANAWRN